MFLLVTLLCAAFGSLQSVYANTITVTNTNDSGAGSLRQGLVDAVDGDKAASSVFYISSGKTVTISGLTITNGHSVHVLPDITPLSNFGGNLSCG